MPVMKLRLYLGDLADATHLTYPPHFPLLALLLFEPDFNTTAVLICRALETTAEWLSLTSIILDRPHQWLLGKQGDSGHSQHC